MAVTLRLHWGGADTAGPGALLGPGPARSWPCGLLRVAARGGKTEESVTVPGFETWSLHVKLRWNLWGPGAAQSFVLSSHFPLFSPAHSFLVFAVEFDAAMRSASRWPCVLPFSLSDSTLLCRVFRGCLRCRGADVHVSGRGRWRSGSGPGLGCLSASLGEPPQVYSPSV